MKTRLLFAMATSLVLSGCRPGLDGPVVKVDDSNFNQVVLEADKPVLVDFHATWCAPCVELAPIVHGVAKDYYGRAVVAQLNVDAAPRIAQRYAIEAVPTLIAFRSGEEVLRIEGLVGKSELIRMLSKAD